MHLPLPTASRCKLHLPTTWSQTKDEYAVNKQVHSRQCLTHDCYFNQNAFDEYWYTYCYLIGEVCSSWVREAVRSSNIVKLSTRSPMCHSNRWRAPQIWCPLKNCKQENSDLNRPPTAPLACSATGGFGEIEIRIFQKTNLASIDRNQSRF